MRRKRLVVKGGDGGTAPAEAMGHGATFAHDRDNAKRVLVCGRADGLVETADPFDAAHSDRVDGGVQYMPQTIDGRTPRPGLFDRPRRAYPPGQIVSSGVSIDSMFDGLHARARRLARDGLSTAPAGAVSTASTLAAFDSRLGRGVRLRDVVHQRIRCDMTPAELALEREASALLRGGCDGQ